MMRAVGGVVFAAFLCGVADAFPVGAGSCTAGTGAILTEGFSHATNMQVGGTALADSGLSVTLDGDTLVPDTATDFMIGEAHTLTIEASNGTTFRGFLARIEGEDMFFDTTTALSPGDNNTEVQVAVATCINVNRVGGITHTGNDDKSSISAILMLDEPAMGLVLDVTVVIRNSNAKDISEWYYSQYILNAVGPPSSAPVAPAPVAAPTLAPESAGRVVKTSVMGMAVASVGLILSMM